MSPSMKPILASKVESTIWVNSNGKEVVQERMQTSDDDRSNSMETDDELPIRFGSIPKDFSVNMAFMLPATFKANEGQSPIIKGDVEESDEPMAEIVDKKIKPKGLSNVKTKAEELPFDNLRRETDTNKNMCFLINTQV